MKLPLWSVLLLLAAACPRKSSSPPEAKEEAAAPAEAHSDEAEHEELPSKVRLSADVVSAARIRTAPAQSEVLPVTIDVPGEIAADPDRRSDVTVRAPGRIAEVHFKEGARVKRGELLATVVAPEAGRTRATVTATEARARTARINAERLRRLAESGLAAGQEATTAESEAQSLEAEATAARQAMSALGTAGAGTAGRLEIRAPIDGVVVTRDAVPGQVVSADHVLARLANLDSVYFLGRLFEKDLSRIQAGAAAEVRLNAYPEVVFSGEVESIGQQLDPVARTVVARILIKNQADAARIGLFGLARIVVGEAATSSARVVVPLDAVTQLAERPVVFVKHADGDFEVHPVTLGRSAASRTEVLSGLREGEEVVVDGAFTLKSVVLKSTFGEDEH